MMEIEIVKIYFHMHSIAKHTNNSHNARKTRVSRHYNIAHVWDRRLPLPFKIQYRIHISRRNWVNQFEFLWTQKIENLRWISSGSQYTNHDEWMCLLCARQFYLQTGCLFIYLLFHIILCLLLLSSTFLFLILFLLFS